MTYPVGSVPAVARLAAPSVATEYTEPAKEVRTPALSVASVIASPAASVRMVNAWPPTAENHHQAGQCVH